MQILKFHDIKSPYESVYLSQIIAQKSVKQTLVTDRTMKLMSYRLLDTLSSPILF